MIRIEKFVNEYKCRSCSMTYLLGETFGGQRCCNNPSGDIIGEQKITEYKKTIEEEKEEVRKEMNYPEIFIGN